MKKYSSKTELSKKAKVKMRTKFSSPRAKKGKVAYRTPSRFIYKQCQKIKKLKSKKKK